MTHDDRPLPAQRLEEARIARGFKTAKAACEYFGWNYVSYSQHESGQRGLSRVADRYAAGLKVSEGWLLTGEGRGPSGEHEEILAVLPPNSEPERTKGFKPEIIPGDQLVSKSRDLPIYAAAQGGDGHIIVTFDPIDYMKMPSVLQNVKGGYGLLLTGESMVPAYRAGETALVNPNLPPVRDTDVILYHANNEGGHEAIIKRLIGMNDREWTIEQYNPANQFKEFRADWPICHRVVGKYNTR